MDITKTTTAMSASLLTRDVYAVCFPERDSLDVLQDELAAAREKFFTGGRRAVKVGKTDAVKGYDGKLKGKLTRRGFYWKKTADKLVLEEAFDQRNGSVVVRRDLQGVIRSRIFFDRSQLWIKSEYYDPWDPKNPAVIFKPVSASDLVERFDWDEDQKRYHSTELHSLPYRSGTAEQSILTARFGEPTLVVATGEGTFCYCPKKEAQDRLRALDEIQDGTIVLMPAWEVKDGAVAGDEGEEETSLSFNSLEEYARIEPEHETEPEAAQPTAPPEIRDTLEFTVLSDPEEPEEEPAEDSVEEPSEKASPGEAPETGESLEEPAPVTPEESEESPEESDLVELRETGERAPEELEEIAEKILLDAEPSPKSTAPEESPALAEAPEPEGPVSAEDAPGEEADSEKAEPEEAAPAALVREGEVIRRQGGLAAYEGEYRDGKRDGFGVHFDRNGSLSYAGSWKEDKKDGLGVSFRDTDHALHIARWENGRPGEFVTLFDKDGNLRYSGKIVDGRKEGAGVSVNPEDGTIFVGKWEHGEPTGFGSSFDGEGNLLYYGGWKDGKRHGHGTEFDGSGGIVFDGEWKDGKYHNGILYQKLSDAEDDSDTPSWE